jgi:hypothetical protein
MKKLAFTLAALAMISTSFTSCKEDEKSLEEVIVSGDWRISVAEVDTNTDGVWENDLDACISDDVYTLQSGGALTIDEGATKCDPADPQTRTGSWALTTGSVNIITLTENGLGLPFTVTSYTDNTINLSITLFFPMRYTFTRI